MAPVKNKVPQFQHLPRDRAKQLKNSWIQAKKIKSKWKAQKLKEGFATGSNRTAPSAELKPGPVPQNNDQPQREPSDEDPSNSESEKHSKRAVDEGADKPSLRELAKKAYAPSSLHNHRADPLHKRKGESYAASRGERGGSGRGRGRGQPNMKLRMNAMLEKIKQDLT